MNIRLATAAMTMAAAVGLLRDGFSSNRPVLSEPDYPWWLPVSSRVEDPIPSFPERRSYRAQVRAARRRRNIQKRGGAR